MEEFTSRRLNAEMRKRKAEQSGAHTTNIKPLSLDEKRKEATVRDEEDVLVVAGQVLEALPDRLGTRSSVFETVWGVIPFFVTGREIELGKLGRYIGARDSFVADGIVGFAQVRPDLELDPGGRAAEKRAEGDESRLDSARHGGHEDDVGFGW